LLRSGIVYNGISKAVSSSKVKRFFIVTATTLPPNPPPLRGGPAQQCWLRSFIVIKESKVATDGRTTDDQDQRPTVPYRLAAKIVD